MECQYTWLGIVPYDAAWQLQENLSAAVGAGTQLPTLLLLEHPHTFTLGRRGDAKHLLWTPTELKKRDVQVRWVDRGGDITYHGPGQLVGYPILPLAEPGWQGDRLPQADYVGYLRRLEQMLILTLLRLGIDAKPRENLTGVWVHMPDGTPAKIASIGIKVDVRGVTRHGFALNVAPQMSYWRGIVPCGLEDVRMTSLEELMPEPPSVADTAQMVVQAFSEVFDARMIQATFIEMK